MISINFYLYYIYCFFAGSSIAAGYIAFITLLGVFDKLAEKNRQVRLSRLIENSIILGVTLCNIFYLFGFSLHLNPIFYDLFLLFGGIFTGCLAGALAETLNLFPILSRRFKIRKFLPYVLISSAIGKAVGCFIQLLLF